VNANSTTGKSPEPKKHHFVPQFLLRNFADSREQLTVHRLAADATYMSSVRALGHRNDGHTLFWPNREPNKVILEKKMSALEGAAKLVVDRLATGRGQDLTTEEREVLAWFTALQWSRNRFIMTSMRRGALEGVPLDPMSNDYQFLTRSLGLVSGLTPLLDAWSARNDPYARPKERWNNIVSMLSQFHWRVARFKSDSLVVSDNIVCLSGVATNQTTDVPTAAWTLHGLGVGFGTCQRVTIPLTPRLGLHLERDKAPQPSLKAEDFNRATVFNSRDFIAYSPTWAEENPRLHRLVLKQLHRQRFVLSVIYPNGEESL